MRSIRLLKKADLKAIDGIYCQAIEAKISTAHTDPLLRKAWLDWFREHDPENFPVFVGEADKVVAGWISFSPYRKGRQALRYTAEISYYVHSDFHRRGLATELMQHAILTAPSLGFKVLIAIIMEPNTASVALLRKFKFELWGSMPGILEVEGNNYDHQYYGLHLSPVKR